MYKDVLVKINLRDFCESIKFNLQDSSFNIICICVRYGCSVVGNLILLV